MIEFEKSKEGNDSLEEQAKDSCDSLPVMQEMPDVGEEDIGTHRALPKSLVM